VPSQGEYERRAWVVTLQEAAPMGMRQRSFDFSSLLIVTFSMNYEYDKKWFIRSLPEGFQRRGFSIVSQIMNSRSKTPLLLVHEERIKSERFLLARGYNLHSPDRIGGVVIMMASAHAQFQDLEDLLP
jgi:hypothetical protein